MAIGYGNKHEKDTITDLKDLLCRGVGLWVRTHKKIYTESLKA